VFGLLDVRWSLQFVAGSNARAQWRRSREAAHRVRVAARRGLKDARSGVRRWARSIRRGNEARSRGVAAELLPSSADDEIAGTLDDGPSTNEAHPVARRTTSHNL
jgi:hypothetical protein